LTEGEKDMQEDGGNLARPDQKKKKGGGGARKEGVSQKTTTPLQHAEKMRMGKDDRRNSDKGTFLVVQKKKRKINKIRRRVGVFGGRTVSSGEKGDKWGGGGEEKTGFDPHGIEGKHYIT